MKDIDYKVMVGVQDAQPNGDPPNIQRCMKARKCSLKINKLRARLDTFRRRGWLTVVETFAGPFRNGEKRKSYTVTGKGLEKMQAYKREFDAQLEQKLKDKFG